MKRAIIAIIVFTLFCPRSGFTASALDTTAWRYKLEQSVDLNNIADACSDTPILSRYTGAGLVKRTSKDTITLFLKADLHSLDCGAPDCYWTDLEVRLTVMPKDNKCELVSAYVLSDNYVDCPGTMEHLKSDDPAIAKYQGSYSIIGKKVNLNSTALKKIILRSKKGSRAIVLEPRNFLYFENIIPGGILRNKLPTGEKGEDESCCWGATSSEVNFQNYDKKKAH